LQRADEALTQSIRANALDPQSLYIFHDDQLWGVAMMQLRAEDVAGMLDGFRVLAPGLRDCTTCEQVEIGRLAPPAP
jgi:hypothetical protein